MTPLTAVNQLISLPFSGLRKRFSVAQQIEIDTNTWKPTNDLVIAFSAYENDVSNSFIIIESKVTGSRGGTGNVPYCQAKQRHLSAPCEHHNSFGYHGISCFRISRSGQPKKSIADWGQRRDIVFVAYWPTANTFVVLFWRNSLCFSVNKTNFIVSYKLNGAISQITVSVYNVVAVTTEGDVTLFAKAMDSPGKLWSLSSGYYVVRPHFPTRYPLCDARYS